MPKFYGVRSHGTVKMQLNTSDNVLDLKSAAFTPSAGNHLLFYKSGVNSEGTSNNQETLWTYDQGSETTINTFQPQTDVGDATTPIIGIKQINLSATSTTLRSKYKNKNGTTTYTEFYRSRLWAWDVSHEYAESEGEATTTSTTMQDKTTLTFTPASTQDYLIIWSAEITNSSTSYDCKVELTVEGTVVAEGNFEANAANIYYPVGGIDIANLASGASRTIKIRYCSENAFGTAKIKNARIAAIPLSGYTVNSQEATDASTASTSYQTAASVTFTPEAKWYLILGSAEVDDTHSLALDANGTTIDEIKGLQFADTTSKCPIVLCGIQKLTAASQTITLYHKTIDGTTVVARRPRIIVIKLGTDAQLITNIYHQQIESDDDDALENETDSVFTVTAADLEAGIGGAGSGDRSNIAQRFRNVVIPNAKTIDEAYLQFFMDAAIVGTPNLKLIGIDEDNTAIFSTLANWQGRARTTAQIDWDPTSGAAASLISTPDIKTIIQEIVDRAGWASDNSLALAIDDDGSVTSEYIRCEDFGSDPSEANHLWIRWNEDLGTQYTQTLTEAATLVDAIVKTPNKVLSESSVLVDAIIKTGGKVLSEAVALVDTALKAAGKVMSEVSMLVDTLTAKITNRTLTEVITFVDEFIGKITARILTETITIVDTITKTTGRIFSEAISLVDSLLKQGGKVLAEIVTAVDTFQIVLAIQRVFIETVTLVDTMLKQVSRTLGDALALADSILNRAGKTLTETIPLIDTTLRTTARILTDALTLADSVLKQAGRTLTESTTLVDTIENLRIKTLTEVIALVDTFTRSIGRAISEAITLADTLLKQGGKQLSEAITLIDTKIAAIGKLLTETAVFTDTVIRTAGKLLTEGFTLTDTIARQTARILTESVPLADTVVKTIGRTLSETLATIDEIAAKITAKILTEVTTLVDSITRSVGRVFTEQITPVDIIAKTIGRAFVEAVTLVDTILNQAAKVLSEAVAITDSLVRTAGKVLAENIPLVDSINRAIGRIFTESATLQDTLTRTFSRIYQESIAIVDSFLKQTTKILQETIIAADTLTRSIGKILSEGATLADTFLKQTARIFTEALTLADTFTKGLLIAKTLTEQIFFTDVFSNIIVGARSIGNFILTNIYDLVKIIKQKLKPSFTIAQTKVAYIAKQEARSFTLITGAQSSYTIQLNKP